LDAGTGCLYWLALRAIGGGRGAGEGVGDKTEKQHTGRGEILKH
jgi:hypothetical protein